MSSHNHPSTTKRYFGLEAVLGLLLFVAVAGCFEITQANDEIDAATNEYQAYCARFDRANMLQRIPSQKIPNLQTTAVETNRPSNQGN